MKTKVLNFSLQKIYDLIESNDIVIDKNGCKSINNNINILAAYFTEGYPIPPFGAYECDKGYLHLPTKNIAELIWYANKVGESSKLTKSKIFAKQVTLIVSDTCDLVYLKNFL